jgi:hypothetical protein
VVRSPKIIMRNMVLCQRCRFPKREALIDGKGVMFRMIIDGSFWAEVSPVGSKTATLLVPRTQPRRVGTSTCLACSGPPKIEGLGLAAKNGSPDSLALLVQITCLAVHGPLSPVFWGVKTPGENGMKHSWWRLVPEMPTWLASH